MLALLLAWAPPLSETALVAGGALLVSVVVSGFEAAFLARDEAAETPSPSKALRYFELHPHRLWATVMVANTLSNILFIVAALGLVGPAGAALGWAGHPAWPTAQVLASTGILIGVGELMPKAHAVARPAGWLRIGAPLLRALQVLLLPVAAPLAALSRRLLREPTPEETALTYDELRHAIEIAEEDDSPAEEKRILRGLVDLGTLAVRDVMLPVERVVALRAGLAQAEVHRIITQEGFSRFPVLGAGWQDVRGVLYAKDLIPTLGQPNPRPWPELLRPAYYVHEGQRINKLLQEFRTQRLHLALVRDNRGQVVGLITLQDILDEIFGEMKDEFDSPAEYAPLAPQEWRLDGRLPYLHLAQMATLAPDVWPGPPQTPVSQVVQALAGGGALRRGQRISGPGYTFEVLATDATGRATQLRFVLQ